MTQEAASQRAVHTGIESSLFSFSVARCKMSDRSSNPERTVQTARFLQQQPLFGAVDDRAMLAIMPLMRELEFAAGEVIVEEGQDGDSLFVICSGSVEVLKAGPATDDVFGKRIAVLKVGDVFGEMELLDTQHRSATVRALEPVAAPLAEVGHPPRDPLGAHLDVNRDPWGAGVGSTESSCVRPSYL